MPNRLTFDARRQHLIEHIDDALGVVTPITLDDFLTDRIKRHAVALCLMAIGDNVRPDCCHADPDISEFFLEVRNLISHEYFSASPERLWHAAQRLPELRKQVVANEHPLPMPTREDDQTKAKSDKGGFGID